MARLSCLVRSYGAWGVVALAAAGVSLVAAPGVAGLFGAALAVVMIAIAAVDARHFVIPDALVVAGLLLGLAAAAADRSAPPMPALGGALLRGAALALGFFVFRAAYRRLRGREGIGLGDVKLSGVAGVWLTWVGVAIAIDIAALSALVVVLVAALRGRSITATTAVPFGLFLAPAIWMAWLFETMTLYGGV